MAARRPPRWRTHEDLSGCRSCGRREGDTDPVLTCPGCGADSDIIATPMAYEVLSEGPQASPCTACELVTLVIELDMVCLDCERLRLDVNDRLRARFDRFGAGDPTEAPCVGCGYYVTKPNPPSPPLALIVECQGCADQLSVPEEEFPAGQGMHLTCGRCFAVTEIPSTIWCPNCGLHLRRLSIPELIRNANCRPR